MRIKILLFATMADRFGKSHLHLELAADATVADALDALQAMDAVPASFRSALAVAVNHAYVNADTSLADGDEVALIPPVSGG